MSELVALREPERLAAVIRGSDVRLVLSGHTHRVQRRNPRRRARVGQPGDPGATPMCWRATDSVGTQAAVAAPRIDILDDGEIVATFVPLTGRDEILYEVHVDESELRPAVWRVTRPRRPLPKRPRSGGRVEIGDDHPGVRSDQQGAPTARS